MSEPTTQPTSEEPSDLAIALTHELGVLYRLKGEAGFVCEGPEAIDRNLAPLRERAERAEENLETMKACMPEIVDALTELFVEIDNLAPGNDVMKPLIERAKALLP